MEEVLYDLCIVGAGMFGSAAARHASIDPSHKVCLVGPDEPTKEERPKREIFSAHYDEGRITRVLDADPVYEILTKHAINRYRELEELSGISFYWPVGLLCIGQKKKSFMEKFKQAAGSCQVPIVDLSYGDIFHKRYPFIKLRDDEYAILEDVGAGYISARNMVAAQKKVAKMQGCHIVLDIVKELRESKAGIPGHTVVLESGKTINAKRVLVCAGAFTNFKDFSPLPPLTMKVKKETVAFLRIPKREAERISSLPSILWSREDEPLGAYILPAIQYPDGQYYLKIGHSETEDADIAKSLQEVKEWYLSKGNPFQIDFLSNVLIKMLPGLQYEEISSMTCVTTKTPSGLPYIDRVTPTVTVAVGGNAAGAKLSDEVGRIAATLSLTGKWDSELSKPQFKIM